MFSTLTICVWYVSNRSIGTPNEYSLLYYLEVTGDAKNPLRSFTTNLSSSTKLIDRLCGVVDRVPGYRSRDPGIYSRRYHSAS
jgi:hypothetical protein